MDLTLISTEALKIENNLNQIWDDIGLPHQMRLSKMERINEDVQNFLSNIEEKETKEKIDLIKFVNEAGNKLFKVIEELGENQIAESEINDLNLLNLRDFLNKRVSYFECERQRRMQKLTALQVREEALCTRLNEEPPVHDDADRPLTHVALEKRRQVVGTLQIELDHRMRVFHTLRTAVLARLHELRRSPSSSLERRLAIDEEDEVVLSQSDLAALKTLSTNLQLEVQEKKDEEEKLRMEIRTLWERLSYNEARRQLFLMQLDESPVENIPKLEEELQSLLEIRNQNLSGFTNKVRCEMEEYWEKCYVSVADKELFRPYFEDEYSENSLQKHEDEVHRLKEFYEKNEDIFLLLNQWQKLWARVTELDERAKDPKRLFGNRGCALLLEEKERRRLNNELPRCEKEIEKRLAAWERENGRTFLVCGRSLSDFIKSQWDSYNNIRNKQKEIRQTKRMRNVRLEAQLGTPEVSPMMARKKARVDVAVAAAASSKCKIFRSNDTERAIDQSGVLRRHVSVTRLYPQMPANTGAGTGCRVGTVRPMKLAVCRDAFSSTPSLNTDSSYQRFTEGLDEICDRENARSSVVPTPIASTKCRTPLSGRATPQKCTTPQLPTAKHLLRTPQSSQRLGDIGQTPPSLCSRVSPATLPRLRRRSARLNKPTVVRAKLAFLR